MSGLGPVLGLIILATIMAWLIYPTPHWLFHLVVCVPLKIQKIMLFSIQ